jgi:hypothetical protein
MPSATVRSSVMWLLSGLVEVLLEGVEALGPEPPVGLEPLVELGEGLGAEGVEASLGVDPDPHEPGFPQHPQVLGDSIQLYVQPEI